MNEWKRLLETAEWNLQVAYLNLHEFFMSWDWGVYTQLFRRNEMRKKRLQKLKSTWAMLYKASHHKRWRIIKNAAQQISIQVENLKCMFTFLFLHKKYKKATAKRLFSSPILPLRACIRRKFGVYMIYEFKMKREWN